MTLLNKLERTKVLLRIVSIYNTPCQIHRPSTYGYGTELSLVFVSKNQFKTRTVMYI